MPWQGEGRGPARQLHHLAVPDLEAAYAFYVDGLGWEPAMHVPGDVLMIQVGDKLLLSLWARRGSRARSVRSAAARATSRSRWPTTCPPARRSTPSSSRPARPGRRTSASASRARVGRLHRLLRRPGRLPLGGRLQPRPHRTDSAALTKLSRADHRRKHDARHPQTSEVLERSLRAGRSLLGAIEARYATGGFATGLEFVGRIGEAAEEAEPPPRHHADLADRAHPAAQPRRRRRHRARHRAGRPDQRHRRRARRRRDARADSSRSSSVSTPHDTRPSGAFWAAVLGYDSDEGTRHRRPRRPAGRRCGSSRPTPTTSRASASTSTSPSPPDQAQASASRRRWPPGGTLVSDERAPSFTVLADPEGNKVCVCTWLGR